MADIIGELVVQITGDTKKFDDSIDKSEKQTKKFQGGLDGISKAAKKILAAGVILAVIGAIKDVGEASIAAATDAEETQNKFNVVFSGISEQANTMADNLAIAYGTSKDAAKDMLAGTGDLLTGLGFTQESAFDLSKQVLSLGADLASFTNFSGGAEGASAALTKALLGERESLKSLGISINEADVKAELLRQTEQGLTFDTEKQAKAQATLTLALSQTANAQGDFARSSESYANQLKIAKARTSDLQVELGRALLPTATKGIGVFSELTGKLGSYIKSLNDVKEAEKAQASGNATREQELVLLDKKIKAEQKVRDEVQRRLDFEKEEGLGIIERTQLDKEASDDKLAFLKKIKQDIEAQVRAEAALAEKIRAGIKAEEDRKKAQEEAAAARKKQHEDDLKNIEKIQEANKTDLEILNAEIQGLKDITGLTESENQKRLQAIEQLQGNKQRIIDEEVEARERAGEETLQANQEIIDAELEAEKNKFDEKVSLYNSYATNLLGIAGGIIDIYTNITNEEIAIDERKAEEKLKIASDTADEQLQISRQALENEININNEILKSARETNNAELESEIQLLNSKLSLKLDELNAETVAETELQEFKDQLAEENRAAQLLKTQQKIEELLLTGEAEDAEEARRLEAKIVNDDALRVLEDAAKADQEARIIAITAAKAKAEADELAAKELALIESKALEETAAADALTLATDQAAQEAIIAQDLADEEDGIEKELARKKYQIELAQFQANKATSILEAGISTAAGIAASLPNLVLAGIVGGLGLVQVAAIASTPDPARPAFAKGGTAERATTAIVGEDGGEVMLGMGAQGSPLIDELATRIGSKIGGGVTNNYYQSLFNTTNPSDLRKFNRINRPFQVAEDQRVGARK